MKKYKFSINGSPYAVTINQISDDQALVDVNGTDYQVQIIEEPMQRKTPQLVRSVAIPHGQQRPVQTKSSKKPAVAGVIKAPLPGLIMDVLVKEGDDVTMGQVIVKMEAMKMENNIQSNRDGKITSIKVKKGDTVLEGDVLAEIGG